MRGGADFPCAAPAPDYPRDQENAMSVSVKPALAAVSVAAAAVVLAGSEAGLTQRSDPPPLRATPVSVAAAAPLDNDASAGRVVFTFDDGPDNYTPALLAELEALHLQAVFFVFGWKALAYRPVIRTELADGDLVENHTYDHLSFTGASTGTPPLTAGKIRAELIAGSQDIEAAGAPAPTLYRPPFGDINAADNKIAASLGLRLVQPFSVRPGGAPIDSRDWTGISAAQIVKDVTLGYKGQAGIHGGSVIGFHDSSPGTCRQQEPLCSYVVNTIRALPGIVAFMNQHHLGVTTAVPENATGGIVSNLTPRDPGGEP
jgi:peptidoglycan/xylan/chitin deacetylase (PgdA/CDA1 family)